MTDEKDFFRYSFYYIVIREYYLYSVLRFSVWFNTVFS